jgi:glycosyltransferase involved in cell wall biosynthesis
MPDLSILIPSRNEMFLQRTIEDILEHIEGDTEIIAVLDGYWPDPKLPDFPKTTVIHYQESIGQRAATNAAAKISQAKYVAKVDAHCAFEQGFDVKMMADMQDDWTMVPTMRNLHAFNWKCEDCGWTNYQGPTPVDEETKKIPTCPTCKSHNVIRDVVWIAKHNPQSNSYCFDSEPHFQYFNEFSKRPEGKGDLTETMSLQGSFFMLTREKYHELNVCDEKFGSWGSQGIEVAVKTWLSGGKVMVNHKTWYAHMFRTQGGDFGFPYPLSGRQVDNAKRMARESFFKNNQFKKPLSWLVKKFWPVPGWTQEALDALEVKAIPEPVQIEVVQEIPEPAKEYNTSLKIGVVYYTDNRLDETIMCAVQKQIKNSFDGEIISASLRPIDFGENIVLNLERGYDTMFKQILAALEKSTADVVYFCEHDVLYPKGYFSFIPPDPTRIYYNKNVWQVRTSDGFAVSFDAKRLSQLVAYRDVLIEHYKKRIELVAKVGFSRRMGFEPGSHGRPERVDDLGSEYWECVSPAIDLKHGKNATDARWSPSEFRSQRSCRNWKESYEIPYWGKTENIIKMIS